MTFKNIAQRKTFRVEFLLLIIGLLIIGAIVKQQVLRTEPLYKPSALASISNLNTYENAKYGYKFNYSKKYRLKNAAKFIDMNNEYGLQMADNQLENSIVNITTIKNNNKDSSTLDYAVNYYTQVLKFNDISIPKTGIIMSSKVIDYKYYPFTNPNGIKGYELYLIEEVTEQNNDKVKVYSRKTQPYFIIELPYKTKALLFIQGGDTDEGMSIIRTYLDSLQSSD